MATFICSVVCHQGQCLLAFLSLLSLSSAGNIDVSMSGLECSHSACRAPVRRFKVVIQNNYNIKLVVKDEARFTACKHDPNIFA